MLGASNILGPGTFRQRLVRGVSTLVRNCSALKTIEDPTAVSFVNVEEAWFWFVQALEARATGARICAGKGELPRPCEPLDMLHVIDRLYRQRRLIRDHLHVLVHYGRRLMAPDPERRLEARASGLWREALACIDPILREKGIVQ
jgi:hypothetical protein